MKTKRKIRSILVNMLSFTIGNGLIFLFPKKAIRLSEKGMTLVMNNNLNLLERLMRHAILKKVEKKADVETLAKLHRNYWVNQGSEFFSSTNDSFENEFLPNCSFIFNLLKNELSNQTVHYTTLVEVGTGNGNVLNYLCSAFPEIDRFIGIDLSPVQIELNRKKFIENKKLEFVASDGFDWVKTHGQGHTIFVTSRGVLEYFTEKRLQAFFKEINQLGKTMFVAIEPNGVAHNFKVNPHSELYGHERSFSHNYPELFKNAGFSLWHLSSKPHDDAAVLSFIGAKN